MLYSTLFAKYPGHCFRETGPVRRPAVGWLATTVWAVLALLLTTLASSLAAAADDEPEDIAGRQKYEFASARAAGTIDGVKATLEVAGKMQVLGKDSQMEELKLAVLANLLYDERAMLVPLSPKAPLRGVRHYEQAVAAIEVDDQQLQTTLRDERRLVAVEIDDGKSTLFSTSGPLQHDELDLIDVPANTLVLDRFLPPFRVGLEDAWKHKDELVRVFLGLDAVSVNRLESKLSTVKDSVALVELSGPVQGAINGVSTEIEIRCKYQFDLGEKRITWFGLLIKEKRSVGHIGPGLDVVARLQIKITPSKTDSPQLTDAALSGISLDSAAENSWLSYESALGGWQLLNDRRWFVTGDEPKSAILRMIDRGAFVAQCNVSSLPQVEVGKLPSLSEFQKDIRAGLGDSFGQFLSAKQETNDLGYRVFRVVVDGKASEVPIQWIYYLLADNTGRQLAMVFVVESELVERLAGADEELAAGAQFVDRSTAARPTPAPK